MEQFSGYIIMLYIACVCLRNMTFFSSSESLSAADDETIVGPAFNALPIFDQSETVTVVRNPTAGPDASFTFTFNSKRGLFLTGYSCTPDRLAHQT